MLETVKAWLNGTRDYNTGALLYNIVGTDHQLKQLFAQGHNMWNNYRLQEEMLKICEALKNGQQPVTVVKTDEKEANERLLSNITDTIEQIAKTINPPNPELYNASLEDAKRVYKGAMNKRAVVFSMIPTDKYSHINRPDLVEARRKLCLDAVKEYNEASALFDQADYVKLQGKLPDEPDASVDDEVAGLEDYEVKPALDNARKAYNKLKGREQTADRVALMQKHKAKIEKLEERWHSLKPQK